MMLKITLSDMAFETYAISERRHRQAQRKVGEILDFMERENRTDIIGTKNLCELIRMDIRTFSKIIGFRIYEADERRDYIGLDADDFATIREAREIAKKFKNLNPERRKIAELIFLANV